MYRKEFKKAAEYYVKKSVWETDHDNFEDEIAVRRLVGACYDRAINGTPVHM